MNLAIANRQRTKKINVRLLKQIVAALFAKLKITEGELGISLVGAKEMARVKSSIPVRRKVRLREWNRG